MTDWVNCPICGESDMSKEDDIINCVNLSCPSNSDESVKFVKAVSFDTEKTDSEDISSMVIYGLIPTDLPSLREPNGPGSWGGKVGAHGLHAGNQLLKYADHPDVKKYIKGGIEQGADHFNTCITLDATTQQIEAIVNTANSLGYVADIVTDPTYPWFVNVEDAKLLNDDCTVAWDIQKDGQVLVTRKAITFAWLLGDKDNDPVFRGLVGALRLAK